MFTLRLRSTSSGVILHIISYHLSKIDKTSMCCVLTMSINTLNIRITLTVILFIIQEVSDFNVVSILLYCTFMSLNIVYFMPFTSFLGKL